MSLISSFYVETINKRRKSPRKWIIHYLRGISISIFYHSPGIQVYWCFILTESHFLDGSIADWKKKSTKNFRLMFGCLVLMEPVNHSYAVPSFSFRDSNREEKLSGTLSLVYHWPFLRFKTRQKPSAKKKGQKQNKTDCSHKIRWWFSHCHAVQTPIQRKTFCRWKCTISYEIYE